MDLEKLRNVSISNFSIRVDLEISGQTLWRKEYHVILELYFNTKHCMLFLSWNTIMCALVQTRLISYVGSRVWSASATSPGVAVSATAGAHKVWPRVGLYILLSFPVLELSFQNLLARRSWHHYRRRSVSGSDQLQSSWSCLQIVHPSLKRNARRPPGRCCDVHNASQAAQMKASPQYVV